MNTQNVNGTASESTESSGSKPIRVHRVHGDQRPGFFPAYFYDQAPDAKDFLVCWFRHHCKGWQGGYLEYYAAENGAFFVAPEFEQKMRILIATSHYCGMMSAEAAGITATLYLLEHQQMTTWPDGRPAVTLLSYCTDQLKAYAKTLEESAEIYGAIGCWKASKATQLSVAHS